MNKLVKTLLNKQSMRQPVKPEGDAIKPYEISFKTAE